MPPILVDIPVSIRQSAFKMQIQRGFRLLARFVVTVNMRKAMRAVVANDRLPFLSHSDFQLYNKVGHFAAICFMTMPFSYSVIQNNYEFDTFRHRKSIIFSAA